MLEEKDLLQIKNLIISYYENNWYFPFFEDLYKKYDFLFPENIDEKIKNQIDDFTNSIILKKIENKKTKWWIIMSKILNKNKFWVEFRKLNSSRFFKEDEFQKLWKEMEYIIESWETKLTERLMWTKSVWIAKTSESWYSMVYAIFPLWNKIK